MHEKRGTCHVQIHPDVNAVVFDHGFVLALKNALIIKDGISIFEKLANALRIENIFIFCQPLAIHSCRNGILVMSKRPRDDERSVPE